MDKNICEDIRIMIIKENGDIDTIFSADDGSIKNLTNLKNGEDIDLLYYQHGIVKDTVRKDDKDKHFFYLKQYLIENCSDKLKQLSYNAESATDYFMQCYRVTTIGDILLINSSEHVNVLFIPTDGITEEQQQRLNDLKKIFNNLDQWEIADNMHIDIEIQDGKKYGFFNKGEIKEGNLYEIIDEYLDKQPKKR